MIIENDKMVSISYILKLNNKQGEIIETVPDNKPLIFIFGKGMLLNAFESNLNGKKTGDSFDFTLLPSEAYGEYYPDDVVDLDIEMFKKDGVLNTGLAKIGNTLPMSDSQGNRFTGTVKNVSDKVVTMDFNHPMAGQQLYFTGKVVDVKTPTQKELEMFASDGNCESDCSGCSGCK
jgi:FKBP-type peptidyl-prolyl cis-trans isomerase SlyD